MDLNARIRATETLLRIFNFSFRTRKTGNVPSIRSIRKMKVPCVQVAEVMAVPERQELLVALRACS